MVIGPEKHLHQHRKMSNQIPGKENRSEERKGKTTKEVKETLAFNPTYPSGNMQGRVYSAAV